MFDLDDRQLKKYERTLNGVNQRAIPFAIKGALNSTAFKMREIWRAEIDDKLIQRNKFTKNSIRVERVSSNMVDQMQSRVGSIASYMDEQEDGFVKTSKGKHGVILPTTYSSGEGENAGQRRKLPRRMNQIGQITLRNKKIKAKSRAQRNAIAVRTAIKNKDKFVFIDTGKRKFIARVIRQGRKGARIKMVHDLTKRSVTIQPNPTMKPARRQTIREIPQIYKKSLQFQLKRIGLSVK